MQLMLEPGSIVLNRRNKIMKQATDTTIFLKEWANIIREQGNVRIGGYTLSSQLTLNEQGILIEDETLLAKITQAKETIAKYHAIHRKPWHLLTLWNDFNKQNLRFCEELIYYYETIKQYQASVNAYYNNPSILSRQDTGINNAMPESIWQKAVKEPLPSLSKEPLETHKIGITQVIQRYRNQKPGWSISEWWAKLWRKESGFKVNASDLTVSATWEAIRRETRAAAKDFTEQKEAFLKDISVTTHTSESLAAWHRFHYEKRCNRLRALLNKDPELKDNSLKQAKIIDYAQNHLWNLWEEETIRSLLHTAWTQKNTELLKKLNAAYSISAIPIPSNMESPIQQVKQPTPTPEKSVQTGIITSKTQYSTTLHQSSARSKASYKKLFTQPTKNFIENHSQALLKIEKPAFKFISLHLAQLSKPVALLNNAHKSIMPSLIKENFLTKELITYSMKTLKNIINTSSAPKLDFKTPLSIQPITSYFKEVSLIEKLKAFKQPSLIERLENQLNDPNLTELKIYGSGLDLRFNHFLDNAILIPLGKEAAALIAKALHTCPSLTKLTLSYNQISNEELKMITDALKTNHTLTELNLSHSNIDGEGLELIAEVLKTNNSLTQLDLRYNKFAHHPVTSILTEALSKNNNLITLDLGSTYESINFYQEKSFKSYIQRNHQQATRFLDGFTKNARFTKEECLDIIERKAAIKTLLEHRKKSGKITNEAYILLMQNINNIDQKFINKYTETLLNRKGVYKDYPEPAQDTEEAGIYNLPGETLAQICTYLIDDDIETESTRKKKTEKAASNKLPKLRSELIENEFSKYLNTEMNNLSSWQEGIRSRTTTFSSQNVSL